jgi:uncharacterized membrane protein (DUF2068 family)
LRQHNKGLFIIAIYKWCTAALCVLLAVGFFKLLHQDVGEVAEKFIRAVRVDPDNHYLARMLTRLSLIEDPQLAKLSVASLGYAALFLIEGTGLYFEQRWAEYLTVIATASFLPIEIIELMHEPNALKLLILIANLAVLVFLIVIIKSKPAEARPC